MANESPTDDKQEGCSCQECAAERLVWAAYNGADQEARREVVSRLSVAADGSDDVVTALWLHTAARLSEPGAAPVVERLLFADPPPGADVRMAAVAAARGVFRPRGQGVGRVVERLLMFVDGGAPFALARSALFGAVMLDADGWWRILADRLSVAPPECFEPVFRAAAGWIVNGRERDQPPPEGRRILFERVLAFEARHRAAVKKRTQVEGARAMAIELAALLAPDAALRDVGERLIGIYAEDASPALRAGAVCAFGILLRRDPMVATGFPADRFPCLAALVEATGTVPPPCYYGGIAA